MRLFFLAGFLFLPALACGPSSTDDDAAGSSDELGSGCHVGATKCADPHLVLRCVRGRGRATRFEEANRCDDASVCRDGACIQPTGRPVQQAASLAGYLDKMANLAAWNESRDLEPVKARERDRLLAGDGSDVAFYGAMWRALDAVGQGHQSLWSDTACGSPALPEQHTSFYGVCARPSPQGLVITYARPGNPLALTAGDQIVTAGGANGPAILDEAALRPVCGSYYPSADARRTSAAASFFGTVPEKTVLTVIGIHGQRRMMMVPAPSAEVMSCADPLGRDTAFNAQASTHWDGSTAIIRLPRFYPINDASQPQTNEEYEAFIARFQASVKAEFDKVKDAPRLVWDARANGGGLTRVALAIVSGMPSARSTALATCNRRIAGSNPPAFEPELTADYSITPGGDFAYAGKTAVLIDAFDYSAADYFAYATSRATDVPLVGEGTAGAFGGAGAPFTVDGPPAMQANPNDHRCLDARDGSALEGRGTPPTVSVGYVPEDVARGVDSVLEAAIARLR